MTGQVQWEKPVIQKQTIKERRRFSALGGSQELPLFEIPDEATRSEAALTEQESSEAEHKMRKELRKELKVRNICQYIDSRVKKKFLM